MIDGWYSDPLDPTRHRYWRDERWTEHVMDADGTVYEDHGERKVEDQGDMPGEAPSPGQSPDAGERTAGMLMIGAGVAVFILCSLAQGAGGSSMFSVTYESTDLASDLLLNATFYPGWLVTGALVLGGLLKLLDNGNP